MKIVFLIILFFFFSEVKPSPPPSIPSPSYELVFEEPKLEKPNIKKSSKFKSLAESKQYVNSTKVVINLSSDGTSEEYELNVTTKNLQEGYFYSKYEFTLSLSEGKSLEVTKNTCKKVKLSGESLTEKDKCTANFSKNGNSYKFNYEYKLYRNEYIVINYKYNIKRPKKEILYRQEPVLISKLYADGFCDFTVNIPSKYKNLGLKNNLLQKKSDNTYIYKQKCPSEAINDVIRFAPKSANWKADFGFDCSSSDPITKDVSLTFPRLYKFGKNRNKNYLLTTNDGKTLKESDLIKDEITMNVKLQGNNNKKIGVKLNTGFSNNLDDEFTFPSESFWELNPNVDEKIKSKVQEIINDSSSEYKGYPNYYKLGKFVNSYLTYDLSYHGRDLTPLQIFEGKRGVCEHYTILYNAMLNVIGIKTIKLVGWALDQDQISVTEDTTGHAWTGALIDGKIKELDSTWGLFEGIPAGHILKTFNQESYSFTTSASNIDMKQTHKLQLTDNLDEDSGDDNGQNEGNDDPDDDVGGEEYIHRINSSKMIKKFYIAFLLSLVLF